MRHKWTWELLDTQPDQGKQDACSRLTELESEGWEVAFLHGGGFSPSGRYVKVWARRCFYCDGSGSVPCDVGTCACPNNCKGRY